MVLKVKKIVRPMKFSSSLFAVAAVLVSTHMSTHSAFGFEDRSQDTLTRHEALSAALKSEQAAKAATTDAAKFEALVKAGELYQDGEEYKRAFTVYEQASAMTGLTDVQWAKVRWGLANAAYGRDLPTMKDAASAKPVRALFDAFLRTPGISQLQMGKARRLMAVTWYRQGDGLAAAQELEKINPHSWDYSDAKDALHYLQESPTKKPSPTALALIDRLYTRLLNDDFADEQSKTFQRLQWADLQIAYGAPARAYAVWAALADDDKANLYDRAQGIEKIAIQRSKENQPALGLKAWERTAKWPAPKPAEANWMHTRAHSRASLYQQLEDEAAVRAELSSIAKMTGIGPEDVWFARYYVAKSHQREMAKWQKTKPSIQVSKAQLQTRATQHEQAAFNIFSNIVNARDAGNATRFDAVMRIVDIEYAKKNFDAALKPILQLRDEWTKSQNIYDDIYLLNLAKVAARIYAAQNKFREAVVALNTGLKSEKSADAQAHEMMRNYLYAALDKNDWNQGREILPHLRGILPPATYDVEALLLEVNSENWPAAATALLNLESANHSYNQQTTDLIAQAKSRIPAEALEKARARKSQN